MKNELNFCLKVLRNGLLLSGMYFVSVWASTQQLDFINHIKPILIFLMTYIGAEMVNRYKIDTNAGKAKKITTLVF